MDDGLFAAFMRYAELVRATLGCHRVFDERLRETGILMLQPDKRIEFLPRVVEHLESLEAFNQLVNHTRSAFPDQFHTRDDNRASRAAQHFFRRCAFYLDVFEGKEISIEKVFERYVKAFQKQDILIWRLTLLDGIDFVSPNSCMSFGMEKRRFQIRRFSQDELAAILGNRVNQVFYPSATIDVTRLQDYWFLSTTYTQPLPQSDDDDAGFLKRLVAYFSRMDQIEPEYKRVAEDFPFGSPQQILALFPWHKHMVVGETEFGRFAWLRDFLPFSIEKHYDFLSGPRPTPFLPELMMDTRIYDLPEGGQLEDERRAIWINLDESKTQHFKAFKKFIEHLEGLFAVLKPKQYGWEFLERALAYFMKALQSTGEERLLWDMTALDALLGENKSKILAKRIGVILGDTQSEKNDIQKDFTSLYKFRSDLVHGNEFSDQVLVEYLTIAHIFARKTLLWFLHFLHALQISVSECHESANPPSRRQLLKLIDGDNDAHQTLRWLKDKRPEFPQVQEWRKWIE